MVRPATEKDLFDGADVVRIGNSLIGSVASNGNWCCTLRRHQPRGLLNGFTSFSSGSAGSLLYSNNYAHALWNAVLICPRFCWSSLFSTQCSLQPSFHWALSLILNVLFCCCWSPNALFVGAGTWLFLSFSTVPNLAVSGISSKSFITNILAQTYTLSFSFKLY